MDTAADIANHVQSHVYLHEIFLDSVVSYFRKAPKLLTTPAIVHSIKTRVKDSGSLEVKIERKRAQGVDISKENVFDKITDLAGIRVIHLHLAQFTTIHECIMERVHSGDWVLFEEPKAYTWDPESKAFFEGHKLTTHVKDSFYTSIHYVIKPRADSPATCEIQVRTLFEEIWGEIDHSINYPTASTNLSCIEQIRVLARLVGAGSRLADSIFRSHNSDQQ